MAFYGPDEAAAVAVARHFADQIRAGELAAGDKLPSAASIARQLDVSNDVARRALRELARVGLTEAHRGRGTWVRRRPPAVVVDMTGPDPDVNARLAELGAVEARDRVEARLPLADEATALGAPPGQPILEIVREYLDAGGNVIAEDAPRLLAGESTRLWVGVRGVESQPSPEESSPGAGSELPE